MSFQLLAVKVSPGTRLLARDANLTNLPVALMSINDLIRNREGIELALSYLSEWPLERCAYAELGGEGNSDGRAGAKEIP
jgi:hypothetical protein